MNEKRLILGYITHPVETKPEIAFPEVKAWIKTPGEVIVRPGIDQFPNSGKVFLHASAATDTMPVSNHYGLFECRPSHKPGRSVDWEVSGTERSLCQVLKLNASIGRPLELYQEIEAIRCRQIANVFLGSSKIYLLTSDDWLIGAFSLKADQLVPKERMMRWKSSGTTLIDSGDKGFVFVISPKQNGGLIFPPNFQDATKRMLKLISKKGRCEFLSRSNISELATELASTEFAEEHTWLVTDISKLLPHLRDTLDASEEAATEILSNPEIGSLLETRWKESHADKVTQEDKKLKEKSEALTRATEKLEALSRSLASLTQEETQLSNVVSGQRLAAQTAFNDEVSRLASNPSHLAILSSLFSHNGGSPRTDSSSTSWKKILGASPSLSLGLSIPDHMVKGLLAIGLSHRGAYEIAAIALAAFQIGQVVSIKSPLAEILADSILLSMTDHYWLHEVPAGLLEPLPSIDNFASQRISLVFSGANRSDYNLVLASFRKELVRQLLVGVKATINAVLTLDSVEGLIVEQPLPVGPCIMREFIKFSHGSGSVSPPTNLKFPADDATMLMEKDEFESIFTQSPEKFAALRDSFGLLMARRFCGSLAEIGVEEERVKVLFLKYWLLPRMDKGELAGFLVKEASLCELDANIKSYLEHSSDE